MTISIENQRALDTIIAGLASRMRSLECDRHAMISYVVDCLNDEVGHGQYSPPPRAVKVKLPHILDAMTDEQLGEVLEQHKQGVSASALAPASASPNPCVCNKPDVRRAYMQYIAAATPPRVELAISLPGPANADTAYDCFQDTRKQAGGTVSFPLSSENLRRLADLITGVIGVQEAHPNVGRQDCQCDNRENQQ
jgi:hypothetical protein